MNKKQRCFFKRLAALVAALLMVCCMTAPALASNNWPASPSASDFLTHRGSWYVWQKKTLNGFSGYELICSPMVENGSTNTVDAVEDSSTYSTSSRTFSFSFSDNSTHTFMYAFPHIPCGDTGYWADLPSFPVGSPSMVSGCVRLYPCIQYHYLSTLEDVFSDRSVFAFLTSWPSSSDSSIVRSYGSSYLDDMPVYVPSNVFFFGDRTTTPNSGTSFGIEGGANDFWATPSNDLYIDFTSSHLSTPFYPPFPDRFTLPSSDVGFVFCKQPSGTGIHTSNGIFNVTLNYVPTLWIPDALLSADVKVGDWISQGTMDKLQDQLVNDFDVNSDTLKNSKQDLDTWRSAETIDSDVANTVLGLMDGLFQGSLYDFVVVVGLLCFGAVVIRVLIRKAVEG